MELLKEVILKLSRVAFFGNSTAPAKQALKETEVAAGAFGLQIQYLGYRVPRKLNPHFKPQARGVLKQSSY